MERIDKMNCRRYQADLFASETPLPKEKKPTRSRLRKSGLDAVGEIPWGTHFCHFYATREDLTDILVPYFREGLRSNEFCMWVASEPLAADQARSALRAAIPDLDGCLARGQVEILDYKQWYTKSGGFDGAAVSQGWARKLDQALKRGFEGMRVTGNTFWLEEEIWQDFKHYEENIHSTIEGLPILALSAYSLEKCSVGKILDVAAIHDFALVRNAGRWERIRSVAHDAELALRESRERLARFAEMSFEGIVISEHGRIVDCNEQFAQKLGYAVQELKGAAIAQLAAPEYREHVADGIRRGLDSQDEYEMLHKDGSRISVEVRGKSCPTNRSQRYSAVRDITDWKRAEAVLKESEERFRAMIQAIPSLTFEGDMEGFNTFVSDAWCAYTGMSAEQARGLGWLDAVHPEDRLQLRARWLDATRTGGVFESQHRLKAADGGYRWFIGRAVPTRDAQGNTVRWSGSLTDIEDLVTAEQSLLNASRRKTEFIATLAHELRNPLAPIRNAVHILKRFEPQDPVLLRARDMIDRQVTHMVRLIDDLLDVGRINCGRLELRKERADLATLLEHAVEAARPHLDQAGHRLSLSLPPRPVHLDADPVRLTQVFLNLLNNAAKYTEPGGCIELEAGLEADGVVVKVRDNGIGIAEENLPHLFEMFAQTTDALERAQGGLGIGLALARGLVEMHGGSISAHSEAVGKGSEFVVRLPALPEKAEPAGGEVADHKPEAVGGMRILVVDDNEAITESLTMLLALDDNEIETANDGLAAIEAAASFRPDVILLDIGLPRLDGYATCRRIRSQPGAGRPLIFALTGWGQEEDRRKSHEAGFDGHLVKPVDPAELLELLAEARKKLR